ncbi:MAG: hypothetical protein QM741_00425 [Rudaea sp.]|uniref:hypothetical protein n=1 Tax=Rudaea sp. TaxID=2136325 RepID=UPI0039E72213
MIYQTVNSKANLTTAIDAKTAQLTMRKTLDFSRRQTTVHTIRPVNSIQNEISLAYEIRPTEAATAPDATESAIK